MHLSAMLDEGDVVMFQTGSWLVDGVRVGDDNAPSLEYARVETIQIVWTHNCEHGVIRGLRMEERDGARLVVGADFVQFGPEQLLARLAVNWDSQGNECIMLAPIDISTIMV